jgi:hypothetical protein
MIIGIGGRKDALMVFKAIEWVNLLIICPGCDLRD